MIVSSIAYVVFFCEATTANSDMLFKRYDIGGPDYAYDNWQYTMDFEVSDFMTDNMIGYSLYDGLKCRDGDGMPGDGDTDITQNDGYLLSRFRTDNTPVGDGSGTRMIKIESQVIPNQMSQSSIYRVDENGVGIVEYCLRFSNYNKDKDQPDAREVNFLETTVKVSIQFEGNFGVAPYIDPVELENIDQEQGVAVLAYLCDSEENIVPVSGLNQGQTIRVCVTPTDEVLAQGFRMREIEEFEYRREIPFSTKQEAIQNGLADQLTLISCRPGSVVCAFDTILFADFFTSEGTISGSGLAFLQIGDSSNEDDSEEGRRLSGLAGNGVGFTINIQVVPVDEYVAFDETDSGAPTRKVATFITTALLAIGLILL